VGRVENLQDPKVLLPVLEPGSGHEPDQQELGNDSFFQLLGRVGSCRWPCPLVLLLARLSPMQSRLRRAGDRIVACQTDGTRWRRLRDSPTKNAILSWSDSALTRSAMPLQ